MRDTDGGDDAPRDQSAMDLRMTETKDDGQGS